MTKILEHASRVLAIMGVALIVWAGMGAQTAKAQVVPQPVPKKCEYKAINIGTTQDPVWEHRCLNGKCTGENLTCLEDPGSTSTGFFCCGGA